MPINRYLLNSKALVFVLCHLATLNVVKGLQQLFPMNDDFESADLILARQWKAKCLLADSNFEKALQEANIILRQENRNSDALFVKAEALYSKCQVKL